MPVVVGLALLGAAWGAGVWHQQLRKRTGVPVLPLLEDTLKPCASMMRSYQEAYELALEEPSA
ncbi:hypothetical protein GCM10027174_45670 [Salinifilum aidingensis]